MSNLKITLSYNETKIANKLEGNYILNFKPITYDLSAPDTHDKLHEFFKTYIYGLNYWAGSAKRPLGDYHGSVGKTNYAGLFGIALDFDDGLVSITEAKESFKNYIFLLHTSTNHMVDVPQHNGIQPRFRVIIPLELNENNDALFDNQEYAEVIYSILRERYKASDHAVFDAGRKFYPFLGKPELYEFYINIPKKEDCFDEQGNEISQYYSITKQEIDNEISYRTSKKKNITINKKHVVRRDMTVYLAPNKKPIKVNQITKTTHIFCPFCSDLDSKSPSADLNIDIHGNYNIYCYSQKEVYWEKDLFWDYKKDDSLFFDTKVGYVAQVDPVSKVITHFKTTQNWESFCAQRKWPVNFRLALPRAYPKFEPKLPSGLNPIVGSAEFIYNEFMGSELLEDYNVIQARISKGEQKPISLIGMRKFCPYSMRILENLLKEDVNIEAFLNWLGFIAQYRVQPHTLWLISTVQGAGKNVFLENVIQPIFNKAHVVLSDAKELESMFNALDRTVLIKIMNEMFNVGDRAHNTKVYNYIKNKVGANVQTYEPKGVDRFQETSFLSLILFDNYGGTVQIDSGDRRVNVVDATKTSIQIMNADWWPGFGANGIEKVLKEEAPMFAKFIQGIKIDIDRVNISMKNKDREKLVNMSKTDLEYTLDKIDEKDIDFLNLENLYPSSQLSLNDPNATIRAEIEKAVIEHSAIPATYAVNFFKHHGLAKDMRPAAVRRILEQHGVDIRWQKYDSVTKKPVKYYKRIKNENKQP